MVLAAVNEALRSAKPRGVEGRGLPGGLGDLGGCSPGACGPAPATRVLLSQADG